jgi:hypothetical protein
MVLDAPDFLADECVDAEFFQQFTRQRRTRLFPVLNLSSREFPFIRETIRWFPLAD